MNRLPFSVLTLLLLEYGFGAYCLFLQEHSTASVLTLLLLEYGFGAGDVVAFSSALVLTLLLLEYGFGAFGDRRFSVGKAGGLNPSSTGIRFRGNHYSKIRNWLGDLVLTLLLLEYGFGVFKLLAPKYMV